MALQALAAFAALAAAHQDDDLTVTVTSDASNAVVATFHINQDNQLLQQSQQVREGPRAPGVGAGGAVPRLATRTDTHCCVSDGGGGAAGADGERRGPRTRTGSGENTVLQQRPLLVRVADLLLLLS